MSSLFVFLGRVIYSKPVCRPTSLTQKSKRGFLFVSPAALSHNKRRRSLVPITPMPHYSDMDTPELKNKLNRWVRWLTDDPAVRQLPVCPPLNSLSPRCRFGVRPLPKRQMILKLKEIHQYTHQLASSDSEDEAPSARTKPPQDGAAAAVANGPPRSSAPTVTFKEPSAPAVTSPLKFNRDEEEAEPLSTSQGSNTSSTAEESERYVRSLTRSVFSL